MSSTDRQNRLLLADTGEDDLLIDENGIDRKSVV